MTARNQFRDACGVYRNLNGDRISEAEAEKLAAANKVAQAPAVERPAVPVDLLKRHPKTGELITDNLLPRRAYGGPPRHRPEIEGQFRAADAGLTRNAGGDDDDAAA